MFYVCIYHLCDDILLDAKCTLSKQDHETAEDKTQM